MAKQPKRARANPRKTRVPKATPVQTGLDDPSVIDTVAHDATTGDLMLVVSVPRPWEAKDSTRLKKKIGAYLEYIASDGLAEQHPDWHQGTVTVAVHAAEAPPEAFEPLFERYAYTLEHQFGLGFEVRALHGANKADVLIAATGSRGTGVDGARRGGWAFAAYVAEQVQATGAFELVAVLDAKTVRAKRGESEQRLALDRVWAASKGKGVDALAAAVAEHARALASAVGASPEDAESRVLPILRPIARVEQIRALERQHGALAPAEIHEPFSREIVLSYVIDQPGTMQAVSPDEANALAAQWEDLHDLAVGNLFERVRGGMEVHTLEDGIFMLAAGGEYESGLLCVAPLWRKLAETVPGDVVAAVPARNFVLFTGSENAPALQALRLRARELYETTEDAIAPGLLRLTPHGWADLR